MSIAQKLLETATDIRRIVRAGSYSLSGLRAAFDKEAAFRQEVLLVVVLGPLALWLGKSAVERVLLLGSLFIVLIVELLNSAIEATVDRIGQERHPLSGVAKDIGSAAVLLALLLAVIVWVLILS